jgi:hypothetical protein
MNPLVLLLVVASASGGLTFWQQQSINRVLAATARLSGQILQTRAALESEQASLASARARLKQIEADLQTAKEDRAALAATKGSPPPTPEQEGWWPEKRPFLLSEDLPYQGAVRGAAGARRAWAGGWPQEPDRTPGLWVEVVPAIQRRRAESPHGHIAGDVG